MAGDKVVSGHFFHGRVKLLFSMLKKINVGGQAVIEGVMMRSPSSLAIVLRRIDGSLLVKEGAWVSVWNRWKFLRKPFFRGIVVLAESLVNGVSALSFSADIASQDDAESRKREGDEKAKPLTAFALYSTIAISLALAVVLFVVLPHMLTIWIGRLLGYEWTVESLIFHAVDGFIKVLMFLGYVWGISLIPEMRRVFQYHGAEHKAIYAFENGHSLLPEGTKPYGTLHPRCGTAFLMVVILISILLFSLVFPFMPKLPGLPQILRNLIYIVIKIPLLLPIAGVSYEIIKLAGARPKSRLLSLLVWPGIMIQKITTKPPTDDQIEVALISVRKCLWRETEGQKASEGSIESYPDFAAALAAIPDVSSSLQG